MTRPVAPSNSQQGAATLTVSLALLTGITMLSIAFSYSEMMEQRIVNNQLRASEAAQAADAGLAFGRAWLSRYRPHWRDTGDRVQSSAPNSNPPPLLSNHGDLYVTDVTFERTPLHPYYVKVRADARARSEPGLIASVEAYARPQTVLSRWGESLPPLVVDGCIVEVRGVPDIYPRHADSADAGSAIASSRNGSCLNLDALDLHGGDVKTETFLPEQAWEYVFRISKSDLKALAEAEQTANLPSTERRYWWAAATDLAGQRWTRSLGSPEKPVVLILPARVKCPGLGAGTFVYGVVFVEGGCEATTDSGSARIYGSLVIDGNLGQLSAQLRLAHINTASRNHDELLLPLIGAPMVPGTWKDF